MQRRVGRWLSLGHWHRRWEEQEQDRQSPCPVDPRTCTYAARRVQVVYAYARARELFGCSPSSTPALTGSVFALPYRMLYAVVTMDTVAIYDMQQAGLVCLLTKRVYGFGMVPGRAVPDALVRDGSCTLVTVDEIFPTHHMAHAAAAQHSVPILYTSSSHSHTSGSESQAGGPLEPLTPAASVDGTGSGTLS
ncbi:hypothetical protein B0H16DRAFT_1731447 [Mycena metata]|uniref:Uncharacterized protein n=1 Tax=Mycena metata TaxID=1033252 RepID=A0AAD7MW30_9AGAR|nr:hypothetical protein B0H16DRAFT_1731447 [Mycena metata]